MVGAFFRPWGEFNWLLNKLPNIKWDFIGCLSTEDRFDGAFSILHTNRIINKSLFFRIEDPPSIDSEIISTKLNANNEKLKNCGASFVVEDHKLLEPNSEIVKSIKSFAANCTGNVIVDISTFPKRFFFPIIKLLLKHNLNNLIVAYSSPEQYCQEDLSANPHAWDHLPLFMPVEVPEPPIHVAIVGVGFMPFGLPDLLLSRYSTTAVKFLFPFPPGPPNYQRTWEFMRKIQRSFTFKPSDAVIRVDAHNMADAYDYITKITHNRKKNPLFAPYGPKPMSLAMCLYAALNDSPVYYTQPTYYNPNYSQGFNKAHGYPIVLNKKLLY
jgi:hypothetical protein